MKRIYNLSRSCPTGDATCEAFEDSVTRIVTTEADDYFVCVLSDANLGRYNISPAELRQVNGLRALFVYWNVWNSNTYLLLCRSDYFNAPLMIDLERGFGGRANPYGLSGTPGNEFESQSEL